MNTHFTLFILWVLIFEYVRTQMTQTNINILWAFPQHSVSHTSLHSSSSNVTSQITARDFVFRMLSAWTITGRNTNLCFRGIELLIPVSGCVLKGARVCIRGCGAAACKECGAGSSEWTQGPRATAPSPGVSAALSPNPTARTSTWAQRCTHVNRQRPGNVSYPPKLIYQRQP